MNVLKVGLVGMALLLGAPSDQSCFADDGGSLPPRTEKKVFLVMGNTLAINGASTLSLYNNSNSTLSTLVAEVQMTDRYGETVTQKVLFNFVDPGKWGDAGLHAVAPIKALKVREIEVCQVGKNYYDDCDEHVGVFPREAGAKKKWAPIPVELKFPEH